MRRLVFALAVVAAILWSLFAWGAYGVLGWAGDVAARNADWVTGNPEAVVWLSTLASWLTGLGLAGIVAVWLLGLGLIFLVPLLLRLLGGPGRRPPADYRDGPRIRPVGSFGHDSDPAARVRRALRQLSK